MQGKGTSRIDTILANPLAVATIADFNLRWDLVEESHVPLQIDLQLERLEEEEVIQRSDGKIKTKEAPSGGEEDPADMEEAHKEARRYLRQRVLQVP